MQIIDILGTKYELSTATQREDSRLVGSAGYCDGSAKKIVLASDLDDGSIDVTDDLKSAQDKITRHEVIHAYFHESGLDGYAENELIVDWIALQFPKILKTFEQLGV